MNSLKERKNLAKQLSIDVNSLFDTIFNIDLKKFNSKAKYKWKCVSTGYTDRVAIFEKTGFLKRNTIIYDIDDLSCYVEIINKEDTAIFEAIEEANNWITGELDLMSKTIDSFKDKYTQHSLAVKQNVRMYNLLSNHLNK